MRRIVFLSAIAVASLLSFSGCDKENPENENGNNETKGSKVETLSAEKGSLCVATLTGRVSGLEGVALDFECGIEYSTDASFAEDKTTRQKADKKYSEDPYTVTITNVSSGQKYYYRAYYISQLMIYYGSVKDFTFTWDAPQVTTLSAELLEMNGTEIYVCKGLINNLGDIVKYYANDWNLQYGIQYSTSESFEASSTQTAYLNRYYTQMGDTIACSISDFKYNTQYYYRAFFLFGSISAEGNTKSFRYDFKPKENGTENGYQYIELGLSVRWATYNVGASKPEEYGDYYAWGETEPKTVYSRPTYKWYNCNGPYDTLTKYNTDSRYGTVDNKTTLDPEDDVAHVKWGGTWRMPTIAEQDELRNNCTWTWTTLNGVNGYIVTSNKSGYTDRSIFLPAAGFRYVTDLSGVGSCGFYWSSSLYTGNTGNTGYAWDIYFGSDYVYWDYYSRINGFSVRPVCQ